MTGSPRAFDRPARAPRPPLRFGSADQAASTDPHTEIWPPPSVCPAIERTRRPGRPLCTERVGLSAGVGDRCEAAELWSADAHRHLLQH